jgi:methionyl aminopeptidase
VVVLKSPLEIERMKRPCRLVAEVLSFLAQQVAPGVTTYELNRLAEEEARRHKVRPAFKGYSNYPYSLCCSVNDQVVHGFPQTTPLQEGDILSMDYGVYDNGFYGDAAITVPVGSVSAEARQLLAVTEQSLHCAIGKAVPGNRLSDISHAVQSYVEPFGFSVVRDFVGHGIGRNLHEDPQVPNFGKPGQGMRLKSGMVLAIEPMINQFGWPVKVLSDGWTAVTVDGGLSAHFEHTVAITENGPEILTQL